MTLQSNHEARNHQSRAGIVEVLPNVSRWWGLGEVRILLKKSRRRLSGSLAAGDEVLDKQGGPERRVSDSEAVDE